MQPEALNWQKTPLCSLVKTVYCEAHDCDVPELLKVCDFIKKISQTMDCLFDLTRLYSDVFSETVIMPFKSIGATMLAKLLPSLCSYNQPATIHTYCG